MDVLWRIEMLGRLRAVYGDHVVSRFRTQKTAVLLGYLAYYPQRTHPRDALIQMLWPEDDLEVARSKLRQALASLRRQFEPPGVPPGAVIRADRSSVALNAAVFHTDAALFEAALRAAAQAGGRTERVHRLTDAVELYRGELLPGHFEEWLLQERERLAEAHLQSLGQLIALHKESGELTQAREYARRAVSADPLREEAHHELIHLLAVTGEPGAALRQYQELERLLESELGAEPAPETRALVEGVRTSATGAGSLGAARHFPPTDPSPPSPPLFRAPPPAHVPHPTGTVTFLAAEVVDTTIGPGRAAVDGQRGEIISGPEAGALAELLRPLFRGRGGWEVHATAETVCAAFGRASDALGAAIAAQAAVGSWQWAIERPDGAARADDRPEEAADPEPSHLSYRLQHPAYRLRVALHVGELEPGEEISRSPALLQAQRLLAAAHPGQTLLSEKCGVLLLHSPPHVQLVDLGRYRLQEHGPAERLFQAQEGESGVREFPPPLALPAHSGSLPPQFTRFFGREGEISRLQELLRAEGPAPTKRVVQSAEDHDPDSDYVSPSSLGSQPSACCRLVTLTGPGGSGKTRLAVEAAARLRDGYGGAVWFVSLQDAVDPRLIPDRLLDAMRLPQAAHTDPIDQVVAFLSQQPSLLVLDNFEHLLGTPAAVHLAFGQVRSGGPEGAAVVQALMERVPSLACLVTSRQRLNLAGEREFAVAPLPVPVGSGMAPPSSKLTTDPWSLTTVPSVALFVDRARAVLPDFQLTPMNAEPIAHLCARLEGIPLALELAAARVKLLTPAQMLSRLDQRFDLLVSRSRGAAPRHGSLRAALDWSYQLLPPELQRFFARLSVFRGGWTLADAEAVCEEPAALDALDQLQECSLVLAEEGPVSSGQWAVGSLGRPSELTGTVNAPPEQPLTAHCPLPAGPEVRFRLLETLREYGAEQLEAEEREALARRHAAHFGALGEAAEPALVSGALGEWLDRLEGEHDNLQAALGWMVEHGEVERGLLLAAALGRFWQTRGHGAVGRKWLEELLAQPGAELPTTGRAKALSAAVLLSFLWGDLDAAETLCLENVATARALGDRHRLAEALNQQGDVALYRDGPAPVQALYEESLSIARELNDPWAIAVSLSNLAMVRLQQGDARGANSLYEESLVLWRSLGDQRGIADTLSGLGAAAALLGELHAAQSLYEQSLTILRALGYRQRIAGALIHLGSLALSQGDGVLARSHFTQSLAVCQATEDRWETAAVLQGLGEVALLEGDTKAARSLHEQSLALHRDLDNQPGIARALHGLARLAKGAGDMEQAGALYRQSLTIRSQRNESRGIVACLEGLADLARLQAQPERAARLSGAAQTLRLERGAPLSPLEQAAHEERLADLRAVLGEADLARAWEAGRALPLEEAVSLGLGTGSPQSAPNSSI
jgi:predicted ATPase/DNA-binding SARP family transcriptional activator